MYACLGVTCHLHFWQNDRGLLRATAVTLGRLIQKETRLLPFIKGVLVKFQVSITRLLPFIKGVFSKVSSINHSVCVQKIHITQKEILHTWAYVEGISVQF